MKKRGKLLASPMAGKAQAEAVKRVGQAIRFAEHLPIGGSGGTP